MSHGLRSWLQRGALGAAVVALALALSGCSFTTPPLSEVEDEPVDQVVDDSQLVQAGTLTVALDTTDAPQVMITSDGTYEGYAVDVALALADSMGLKVAFVSFVSPQDAIESGEADIYLGATTRNQSDDIRVQGEYLQNATAVFGISDSDPATVTADDLARSAVGVQDGSASQEALTRMGITTENVYDNVNECFDALASGEVDYVACDATAGAYLARTYEGVFFAGTIGSSTSYGIAYASSATDLADAVGAALDEISADGTLDAIHVLWYGSLPLNLSSAVLSGVTITEEPEATGDDATAAEDPDDHSDINDY